jgi:glycosyltransferase involved in cell wall biosynthesis
MKIVEVITHLNAGGAQNLCVNLCEQFVKQGHDVSLIVLFDGGQERYLRTIANNPKIHYFSLHKKKGFSFKISRRLFEIIDKIHPDVIHTHLASIGYLCADHRFSKYTIFHTVHTLPKRELHWPYRLLLKLRISQNWSLQLIGISTKISELERFLYPKGQIITIFNGFKAWSLPNDQIKQYQLISVGRFETVKNYPFMTSVLSNVKKAIPTVKMIIVGDGPERMLVRQESERLGLENNLELPGQLSNPADYLQKSSLFVLCSKAEGNPISVLEAMFAGLPIVAPNVGGLPDIVPEDCGILYEPGSSSLEIAEIIKDLLQQPKEISRLGKNAHAFSLKFEIANTSKQYLLLFEKESHQK